MKKITGNRWYIQCFSWMWTDFKNPVYKPAKIPSSKKFYAKLANKKLRHLFKKEIRDELI